MRTPRAPNARIKADTRGVVLALLSRTQMMTLLSARRLLPVLVVIPVIAVLSGTPAQAAPDNVVLYASDVTAISGAWSRVSDSSSAGGQMMTSATTASSHTSAALATPMDYFESAFTAAAGTPYHVWVRLHAAGDSKWSDSLWLQFSDAALPTGAAVYRSGSTNGLLVNLATDGTGSSDRGWGWQDGAYWLTQSSTLQFASSGTHTLRVQIREAGVQVDQIVLSPSTYLNTAPGPVSGDATIVPKPVAPGGTSPPAGLSPYTGVPASVPGTILASNFDNGGEGVAYHDTTPGNTGGAYRQTGVDIQPAADGGYNVGWTAPGEWLNYTVNVAAAGSYTVHLRVASVGGASLHVGFNGPSAGVWPSVVVPNTGGWQAWTDVAVPVSLGAGIQQLTVMFDTGAVNLESISVTAAGSGTGVPTAGIPHFSHAYVIVLENHELSDIVGNPAAPYLNQLAAHYGLATAYAAVTHPSLPNYMALTGGDTYFPDDCVGCTVSAGNITDQLESAGFTWKAYMESMPAACGTADTSLYATKHDPFIHYNDIVGSTARCQAHVVPWSAWTADAAAGTIPSFVWMTPNLCSDMHDCSVATGDAWLSSVVPQILRTPDFGTSVLFIVWDEGASNVGGGGLVPLVVVSPLVTPGFISRIPATHFDLLRTIEDVWGLPALGRAAGARDLDEFFQH